MGRFARDYFIEELLRFRKLMCEKSFYDEMDKPTSWIGSKA